MLEKQRHEAIVEILAEQRFASVHELSVALETSEVTIRRDIVKLADADLIKRIRGGAESVATESDNRKTSRIAGSAFQIDKSKNAAQKRMIAKKAVELCEDGEAIIINGGSSTFMMGEFLVNRRLTILTNSMVLAEALWETGENQISLPGGEIYRKQGIILSSHEIDGTQNYSCSKMFMGTPGIGEFGVTESDPLLIRAEQKLRKQAEKLIVLADSSKLGKRSNFVLTQLDDVDVLITDYGADPEVLRRFEQRGVEVIVAEQAPPQLRAS
ncbi:MAG: DeoR/GlpR family DNA-binding transcription regulator [Pseudomonadota bacterium]